MKYLGVIFFYSFWHLSKYCHVKYPKWYKLSDLKAQSCEISKVIRSLLTFLRIFEWRISKAVWSLTFQSIVVRHSELLKFTYTFHALLYVQVEELQHIKIFRFECALFFANSEYFKALLYKMTVDPSRLRKLKKKADKEKKGLPTIETIQLLNTRSIRIVSCYCFHCEMFVRFEVLLLCLVPFPI